MVFQLKIASHLAHDNVVLLFELVALLEVNPQQYSHDYYEDHDGNGK